MNIKMILDNGFYPDMRVYKEARSLTNLGHCVEILCIDTKNKMIDKPIEYIDGFTVRRFFCRTESMTHRIETNKVIGKFKIFIYLIWFIKFFNQVHEYLKTSEYDIIHAHDLKVAFLCVFYFRKKKKVFDMHELYVKSNNKLLHWIQFATVRFVQNNVDYIIHVSEAQIVDINIKNKNKLIFLPNYPIYKEYKQEKKIAKEFRVCYIGSIRSYILMYNLAKACCQLENVSVHIHGAGLTIEQEHNLMQLGENIFCHGIFDGATDASDLFSKCDLLYCVYDINNLNWKLAMPVKLYEAIVSATPVIASKDSTSGNFVEKTNIGYTVTWNDIEEIKKKVLLAKNDHHKYEEKRKALLKISQQYSWESVVCNLEQCYK